MFWHRKTTDLTAESFDARMSMLEMRMTRLECRREPADQHGLEDSLASLARAAGFTFDRAAGEPRE